MLAAEKTLGAPAIAVCFHRQKHFSTAAVWAADFYWVHFAIIMQGAGFEPANPLGDKVSHERQRLYNFCPYVIRRSLDLNLAPLTRLGYPCDNTKPLVSCA